MYAAFPEKEGPTWLVLRGQGGEEIALAVAPAPGGTRVRASTLLFDQPVDRFLSTLPSAAGAVPRERHAAGAGDGGGRVGRGAARASRPPPRWASSSARRSTATRVTRDPDGYLVKFRGAELPTSRARWPTRAWCRTAPSSCSPPAAAGPLTRARGGLACRAPQADALRRRLPRLRRRRPAGARHLVGRTGLLVAGAVLFLAAGVVLLVLAAAPAPAGRDRRGPTELRDETEALRRLLEALTWPFRSSPIPTASATIPGRTIPRRRRGCAVLLERARRRRHGRRASRRRPPARRAAARGASRRATCASLEAMSARGGGALFLDTILNDASWARGARRRRRGARRGGPRARRARPCLRRRAPAGPPRAGAQGMGFCLVNNVVVAARHAQRGGPRAGADRRLGRAPRERHPGAGRARRHASASSRCTSTRGIPGTGMADERGVGNVFNVPRGPRLPARALRRATCGTRSSRRRRTGRRTWCWSPPGSTPCPAIRSAGFTLEPEHYADLTRRLRERLPRRADRRPARGRLRARPARRRARWRTAGAAGL